MKKGRTNVKGMWVALRKESVDRNQDTKPTKQAQGLSLSARRAWIEIALAAEENPTQKTVALRKESVDRNSGILAHHGRKIMSLSARRAWIEIVAPDISSKIWYCRSPQGERG